MTAATLPQRTAVTDGTGLEPALIPGWEPIGTPPGNPRRRGPDREDFRGAGIGVCGGSSPWPAVSRQSQRSWRLSASYPQAHRATGQTPRQRRRHPPPLPPPSPALAPRRLRVRLRQRRVAVAAADSVRCPPGSSGTTTGPGFRLASRRAGTCHTLATSCMSRTRAAAGS
jgi:hypothetical protein